MLRAHTATHDVGRLLVGDDEEYVLISDDTLIPSFAGASLVDGEEFGYRLTSLGFGTVSGTGIAMSGDLATGLTATLNIPRADPVHPYKHGYHPDHDGLDPLYNPQATDLSPILTEVWDSPRAAVRIAAGCWVAGVALFAVGTTGVLMFHFTVTGS